GARSNRSDSASGVWAALSARLLRRCERGGGSCRYRVLSGDRTAHQSDAGAPTCSQTPGSRGSRRCSRSKNLAARSRSVQKLVSHSETIDNPVATPRILRNATWNIASSALPLVAGVFAIPILVKQLGTERFGVLSL